MRLLRRAWAKLLVLAMAGGTLFQVANNCVIFKEQQILRATNWTWFLTCETGTLFSGNGLLVDCEGSSTGGTSSTTTSGSTSTTGSSLSDLINSFL